MRILKWFLYLLLIPLSYFIISLLLTFITVDRNVDNQSLDNTVFLSTNGVHLDIILPKKNVSKALLSGLKFEDSDQYLSFGWGDENFYINTPSWSDLSFNNAFRAMFLKSSTLMHVTRYPRKYEDWIAIKISEQELEQLNTYILETFKLDNSNQKMILNNQGYSIKMISIKHVEVILVLKPVTVG